MTILEFEKLFEQIAPQSYAQKWDNVGLLMGDRNNQVKKIMCVLDITMPVVTQAIEQKIDLIISHHPLIFKTISLLSDTSQGKIIIELAKNNIAVFAAHTNLDSVDGGINDFVAKEIGLINIHPLNFVDPNIQDNTHPSTNLFNDTTTKQNSPFAMPNNLGIGRVGFLSTPIMASEYKKQISEIFEDKYTSIIGDANKIINKVAIINGSGGDYEFVDQARVKGVDCLITAEVKHHIAIYAISYDLTIIEPHHFNMEFIYIKVLVQFLNALFAKNKINAKAIQSSAEIDYRT